MVLTIFCFFSFFCFLNLRAEDYSFIVAILGEEIISYAQVRQEALVEQINKKGYQSGIKFSSPELKTFAGQLVVEKLLVREAGLFQVEMVTAEERRQILENFRKRFSTEKEYLHFLQVQELSVEKLEAVLARPIIAQKFIKNEILKALIIVTEQEAKKYYEGNISLFASQGFEKVKEKIILNLKRARLKKRLAEWVASLKERYHLEVSQWLEEK